MIKFNPIKMLTKLEHCLKGIRNHTLTIMRRSSTVYDDQINKARKKPKWVRPYKKNRSPITFLTCLVKRYCGAGRGRVMSALLSYFLFNV